MSRHGSLVNCGDALGIIAEIEDPVTKTLVNMALVHFVMRVDVEKSDFPSDDFDMRFVAEALRDFFSQHDVLARTLKGEKVGAWFSDAV